MTPTHETQNRLVVPRLADLSGWLNKKSHFLFGPRQTGKSFLVRHALPDARVYDLLDSTVYLALSQRPSRLAEELSEQDRIVVIDEIQQLPILLNEVPRNMCRRRTSDHFGRLARSGASSGCSVSAWSLVAVR